MFMLYTTAVTARDRGEHLSVTVTPVPSRAYLGKIHP